MSELTSNIIKKQLRYQGKQYGSGVRGGSKSPHMFTQAADRIELLENTLKNLLNDCINFNGSELSDCYMKAASKVLQEDNEPEKLLILADACSDLILGGERGWENMEFDDFVSLVRKNLKIRHNNV
jgi:hypothetical protein